MKTNTKTRAQAQKTIANTNDPDVIRAFLLHENSHIKRYAAHKLDVLLNDGSVRALLLVLKTVHGGDFSKVEEAAKKLKRSEASKKAAATRRAKKAAEVAAEEKAA